MTVSYLGFLFALSRFADEEAGNPKMPVGSEPQKSLLSLSKGPRKEQPPRSENFKALTALLQTNMTENTAATPLPT